jgi:hypothetical protein
MFPQARRVRSVKAASQTRLNNHTVVSGAEVRIQVTCQALALPSFSFWLVLVVPTPRSAPIHAVTQSSLELLLHSTSRFQTAKVGCTPSHSSVDKHLSYNIRREWNPAHAVGLPLNRNICST